MHSELEHMRIFVTYLARYCVVGSLLLLSQLVSFASTATTTGGNRGNIRAVVDDNGRLMQATDYLAFGLPVTTLSQPLVDNRLYEGNEFQNFRGLGWTDNTARRLDNILCRFTAVDPLAEKYPDISPYASRANNSFKYVDLMGDSVTVLINPNGAGGFGHLAILIQNNEGKWQLYSKNGKRTSSESSSKASKNDVAEGDYSSPLDFLNDDKRNPKDAKSGTRKYTKGFVIPTTKRQDFQAIKGALSELKKNYNVLGSNCAATVQKALEGAELDSGHFKLDGSFESFVKEKVPLMIFYRIVNNNNGHIVSPE